MEEPTALAVTFKLGDGSLLGSVSLVLSASTRVRDVADALRVDHPLPLRALVFRGRVLGMDQEAREAFAGIDSPVVYVVFESRRQPPAPETDTSPSASRCCRICLGDDETSERLFRPCNCRGTSALVHLSCLNAWRETNPVAQRACQVCGYEYRLHRAQFARFLATERFVQGASIALLILLILMAGLADFFIGVEWWYWAELERPEYLATRMAIVGIGLVGGLGFATHLAQLAEAARAHGQGQAVLGMLAMSAANGKRGLRLLVLAGLATVFPFLQGSVEQWVRHATVRWGERVLAVDSQS